MNIAYVNDIPCKYICMFSQNISYICHAKALSISISSLI